MPHIKQPIHDHLWACGDTSVSDSRLSSNLVVIHSRRRHVLHLRWHWTRPWFGQSYWVGSIQRELDGHSGGHGHICREDMENFPGSRRRSIFLRIYADPLRDSGYTKIPSFGEQDDEEGVTDGSIYNHRILFALWRHGLRGLRQQCSGQPLNRLWFLQPLLACRYCECSHCNPLGRSIPGVLPAAVRVRGGMDQQEMAEQQISWQTIQAEDAVEERRIQS
eukprot:TRINITY_DN2833_c0_g1_i1.p2 TRINITY_DN2833_c0_g1~~TRINITY_DN2833_c0_g1_i1.p2  ORF type:complete len:220 (+),score=3.39 TRINITY_DN2833_c0_g1_i1:260-919(+)